MPHLPRDTNNHQLIRWMIIIFVAISFVVIAIVVAARAPVPTALPPSIGVIVVATPTSTMDLVQWRIPEPPLYPTAQNVRAVVLPEGRKQDIFFETAETPTMVVAHYERVLQQLGWEKVEKRGWPTFYSYKSVLDGPSYSFYLDFPKHADRTEVHTTIIISGPFPVFFPTTTLVP